MGKISIEYWYELRPFALGAHMLTAFLFLVQH